MPTTKRLKPMPMRPAAVDGGEVDAEEAQHHFEQVEEHDAAGGRDDAHAELLRDLDHAGAIDDQQDEEGAEGEADGLNGDAGIAQLKSRRESAQDQAFKQRVDGRCDRRTIAS